MASNQPGFLGAESARKNVGITVSYWKDIESIKKWKKNIEHIDAQRKGRDIWYSSFKTRSCKVESDYEFTNQINRSIFCMYYECRNLHI